MIKIIIVLKRTQLALYSPGRNVSLNLKPPLYTLNNIVYNKYKDKTFFPQPYITLPFPQQYQLKFSS